MPLAGPASVDAALEEEQLEEMFDDIDIPAELREARMAQVKDYQMFTQRGGFGSVEEISEEREATFPKLMEQVAKERVCVVHFMHPEFRRCQIISYHLDQISAVHFKTRFLRFQAEKGVWVSQKLKVKQLPTVVCFVDGTVKDRIVGFDELGNTDSFETSVLEARIAKSGVIAIQGAAAVASTRLIFGETKGKPRESDSDEDSD